jgi:hypothetical protein
MKVLLLIPPEVNYIEATNAERVDRQREHRPNLGILYVASYLEKNRPQYELKVLDAASEGYSMVELALRIRELNPDVVGLTAMTFTLLDALAAARLVKQIKPEAKVVLGGWHPTYYPLETLKQDGVDYVVHREGEVSFAELCDRLADHFFDPALEDVEGIAYRKADGGMVLNPPRPVVQDLDELPPPNCNLANIRNYHHILGSKGVTLALQSSRGCPFGCTFCDIRRTKLRQRSSESVVAEIRRWYDIGIRSFFFVDDNFVINKKWTLETCEMIAGQGLDIEFKISARVDLIDNPERIQSCGLNLGIRQSRGEWIMRLDAHAHYTTDYLRLCHETALQTGADNVGGIRITHSGGEGYQAKLIQALTTHKFGVGNSNFRTRAYPGRSDTVPFGYFRRDVFDQLGLIDERLVRTQDYEFNRRLLAAGRQIYLNPVIRSSYFNMSDLGSFLKKQLLRQGPYTAYMWYLAPYAFSLRHAITVCFAIFFWAGIILSSISLPFSLFWLSIMSLYVCLGLLASIQQSMRYRSIRHLIYLPLGFLLFHLCHGTGVLLGLGKLVCGAAPVQRVKEPWPGAGKFRAWP